MRIATEAACRTAAMAAGKTFSSVVSNPDFPRGCYLASNNAFFNTHPAAPAGVGNQLTIYQLLCATATIGAPPHCSDARA